MSDDANAAPRSLDPLPESLLLPLLAILLFFLNFFWQALAQQVLLETSFFGWPDAPPIVAQAQAKDESPETKQARSHVSLWGTVLAFPFFLISLPVVLRAFPDVSARSLGLSPSHLARHAFTGVWLGLFLTPVIVLLNLLVQWWFSNVAGGVPETHPFSLLAESGLPPLEWVFLFLGATVVAPCFEELLFRGVLQHWFLRCPAMGWAGMLLAAVLAFLLGRKGLITAWPQGGAALWLAWCPVLFILVLLPHFLILRRRGRTAAPSAIFASSVAFAAIHSFAWPTPVALLALGIALGWLAHRQGSLAGPIALHAVFNALNFLLLVHQGKPGQ